jgi:hypothetical protein
MREKKRTTVTTIETHEVWIVRRPTPRRRDDAISISPLEITPHDPDAPSSGEPVGEGTERAKRGPLE